MFFLGALSQKAWNTMIGEVWGPNVEEWHVVNVLRSNGSLNNGLYPCISERLPSRKLTYPTLGKGKSSSKCHLLGICYFPGGYWNDSPFFLHHWTSSDLKNHTVDLEKTFKLSTWILPGSLTASFPLKISRAPKGKDHLQTIHFSGAYVKLRGCNECDGSWTSRVSLSTPKVSLEGIFFIAGRADNSYVSKHGYGKSCTCQHAGIERKFQQTPGTYPGPGTTTCLWRGSFIVVDFWDIWGMFQESVGFFLEALIFLFSSVWGCSLTAGYTGIYLLTSNSLMVNLGLYGIIVHLRFIWLYIKDLLL